MVRQLVVWASWLQLQPENYQEFNAWHCFRSCGCRGDDFRRSHPIASPLATCDQPDEWLCGRSNAKESSSRV